MSQHCYEKLALGTVQFGLNYGISNSSGKTPPDEVDRILETASALDISMLDTASLYGDSEEVIGMSRHSKYYSVVTKTPYFENSNISDADVALLGSSFNISCEKLKRQPYGLMIHSATDLLKTGGEKLFYKMKKLKSSGMVKKIGVSVYAPEQCKTIFRKFEFDLIQLPLNIYDQRFLVSGVLDELNNKGVEIHVRSIFLQGLLLMDQLPEFFEHISRTHEKFKQFCNSIRKTPLEVAYMFVANLKQVDKVVVGVNTANQLSEIVSGGCFTLPSDLSEYAVSDEKYINPSNWN